MKKLFVAILLAALGIIAFAQLFPKQLLQMEYARLRFMAGASSHHKTIDGESWPYLEAGNGDLIVLVHGFTGSKENWLNVMGSLAKTHRVIAVDLPGWGESPAIAGHDYSPQAQAQRLQQFLTREKTPAKLLVGHSMGGLIVGLHTLQHPQQVPHVVLMSSAGVQFNENRFTREVFAGRNPFNVYTGTSYREFMRDYLFVNAPFVPLSALEYLQQQRIARQDFEAAVFNAMRNDVETGVLQNRLSEIKQPIGLLWCDQDQIVDASASAIFAKGLVNHTALTLKKCGHMPMMEQPNPVAEFLLQQLN